MSALSDINAFNAGKKRDKALELVAAWLPEVEKFSKEIGNQDSREYGEYHLDVRYNTDTDLSLIHISKATQISTWNALKITIILSHRQSTPIRKRLTER